MHCVFSHIVAKYNIGLEFHHTYVQLFVSTSFTICSNPFILFGICVFVCLFVFVYLYIIYLCVRLKFIAISKSLFHFDFDFELKYPIWNLVVKKNISHWCQLHLWMSIFILFFFSIFMNFVFNFSKCEKAFHFFYAST